MYANAFTPLPAAVTYFALVQENELSKARQTVPSSVANHSPRPTSQRWGVGGVRKVEVFWAQHQKQQTLSKKQGKCTSLQHSSRTPKAAADEQLTSLGSPSGAPLLPAATRRGAPPRGGKQRGSGCQDNETSFNTKPLPLYYVQGSSPPSAMFVKSIPS